MSTKHATRLTFVRNTKPGRAIYQCSCNGGEKEYDIQNVESGNTKSCGCLHRELLAASNTKTKTKHGRAGTPLYQVWQGAKQRCSNPKHRKWKDYGGIGITMCSWLKESFDNFLKCVGERPEDGRNTIDRADNNGGYWCGKCPECEQENRKCNLRWVTPKKSSNNRRSNRPVTWKGTDGNKKTMTVSEWSDELKIDLYTLIGRLNRNWSIERAFTTPPRSRPTVKKKVNP